MEGLETKRARELAIESCLVVVRGRTERSVDDPRLRPWFVPSIPCRRNEIGRDSARAQVCDIQTSVKSEKRRSCLVSFRFLCLHLYSTRTLFASGKYLVVSMISNFSPYMSFAVKTIGSTRVDKKAAVLFIAFFDGSVCHRCSLTIEPPVEGGELVIEVHQCTAACTVQGGEAGLKSY